VALWRRARTVQCVTKLSGARLTAPAVTCKIQRLVEHRTWHRTVRCVVKRSSFSPTAIFELGPICTSSNRHLKVWEPKQHTNTCYCDTRFAKKRSWRLFFLFFSHSVDAFWKFGIWGKSFTSRAVEFVWLGACDGVGSCRVGELGRDSCFGPLTFPNPSRPFSP
jgi:hypothetical protein